MTLGNVSSEAADRELERRIIVYLSQRQVPQLRALQIKARNGVVTLSGRVRSFYTRQLAVHCCQRVAGVNQVVDRIEVAQPLRSTTSEAVAAVG